jgi:L-glyceraldehyde 3-phosphate reductase
MSYSASPERYENMQYRRVGRSGLKLPLISLGLWHNFGAEDNSSSMRDILTHAFDSGITHFDLANNYGPPPGSAEENFGKILKKDFSSYRDELIISTKAGYYMWPGPYGDWGSKKYLISSLDQSLKRMQLEYVDIFYSHRFDPETPLEETMHALETAVKSGKALYAGISSYGPEQTQKAYNLSKEMGFPLLIHQPRYSMFDRWIEDGLIKSLEDTGMGAIAFSPLAQGLLTNRYLKGIAKDSRVAKSVFLNETDLTEEVLAKVTALNAIAQQRGQSLAQMALAWVLRVGVVSSALVGVSRVEQLKDNIQSLKKLHFTEDEYAEIERILAE